MINRKIILFKFRKHVYMSYEENFIYGYIDSTLLKEHSFRNEFPEVLQTGFESDDGFRAFVEALINDVKILEWKSKYHSQEHIMDGEEWEINIRFDSGKTKRIFGMNAYPREYKLLMKLLDKHFYSNLYHDYIEDEE